MKTSRRLVALAAVAGIIAVPSSLPALAQSGAASDITHRQSVLTEVSPSGEAENARVFTQLTVVGDGEVAVALPDQSTEGLRNLVGLGSPHVDGDTVHFDVAASRDGTLVRTVADHVGDDPVEFEITYDLDGQPVEPGDVVGANGRLTVTYTIRNTTAEPVELQFADGKRRSRSETVDIAVPMVGSLSITLDDRFSGVTAPGAAVAGDGRGNTVVNFSLLLFSPIGSDEQSVSYTADVVDAVVPEVRAQVLPVSSESFGSLQSSEEAYQGAVLSTRELTRGALQLDQGVEQLGRGSSSLLDGLVQLRDGMEELSEGLNQRAAPGAQEVSDGLGRARSGGSDLADGLGDLRDGAARLDAGLGDARNGGIRLSDGLRELSGGANRLSAGLQDARGGGAQLNDGLDALASGGGDLDAGARRLAAGASQLDAGAGDLVAGATQLRDGNAGLLAGLQQLRAGVNAPTALPAAVSGVTQLRAGIGNLLTGIGAEATAGTLLNGIATLRGGLQTVSAGAAGIEDGADRLLLGVGTIPGCNPTTLLDGNEATDTPCGVKDLVDFVRSDALDTGLHPAYAGLLTGASDGIGTTGTAGTALNGLEQIRVGATQIQAGVDPTDDVMDPTLLNGLRRLQIGLDNPAAFTPGPGFNPDCQGAPPAFQPCGVRQGLQLADGGLGELGDGLEGALATINGALGQASDAPTASLLGAANALANGSDDLADGAQRLKNTGTAPVAAGAQELSTGAQQLADGADRAAGGGGRLVDGLVQLDDGASQLATGAGTAASGGGDLVDGLRQLADGSGQLSLGAGRAAVGAGDLRDGLVQLDDGMEELAEGIGTAADGADQVADGLVSAANGGELIDAGVVQLREDGTLVLSDAVSDASADAELLLETIKAVDDRGKSGDGLPYGTVDGAQASAVFQYEIAGLGQDPGPSTAVQLLLAIVALGLAGGLAAGVRRMIA